MKKCNKCGIEKDLTDFHNDRSKRDSKSTICKTCRCANTALHRKTNPEYMSKWRSYNQDHIKDYNYKHYHENLVYHRNRQLKRTYGISLDEYEVLLSSQGEGCAICGVDSCLDGMSFTVDHNHETGEVRGILCRHCNTGLGMFKDSPNIIKNAYQYLIEKGHYGQEPAGSP